MKRLLCVALAIPLWGCASDDNIDQEQLATYREAVPSMQRLLAASPSGNPSEAVGDPAMYPAASADVILGVNGSVEAMVTILRTVVMTPPTLYNSETQEFFWGPFPNDDGFGTIAAYIRATPGEDFEYAYAFLRGPDQDVANLAPIIWGAATPDPDDDDKGVGVTLWDFEANYAFEETHNPDFASLDHDRGRFVALYGSETDANDANAESFYVVAAFRGFVSKDNPSEPANDLDYFYGRHQTATANINFLDFEFQLDVDDPPDGTTEDVGVCMAFFDSGIGRAESDASGGSLDANDSAEVHECWDTSLARQWLSAEVTEDGSPGATWGEGEESNCPAPFTSSLDDLGVPSLQDVDAELLSALDEAATNGIPQ